MQKSKAALQREFSGEVLEDEPLSKHSSYKIGGPADLFVIPYSENDVITTIKFSKKNNFPLYIIGNGTKLLVGDRGVRGIVMKISNTLNDLVIDRNTFICGAGCSLTKLINAAESQSLSGLEFACGIPGTLGGAITLNAGTASGAMSDVVHSVKGFDINTCKEFNFSLDQCNFSYRNSIFLNNSKIILSAKLKLLDGDREAIRQTINKLGEKRANTQPLDKPNAGSIFKNPEKRSAGQLIELAGLKGKIIGSAQISEKHANFIVNLGNATAKDVLELISLCRREIKRKFDVDLSTELQIIGEF